MSRTSVLSSTARPAWSCVTACALIVSLANVTLAQSRATGPAAVPVPTMVYSARDERVERKVPDYVVSAFTVRAAPREFRVIRIPFPSELALARNTRFAVFPSGTVTVLGRMEGDVDAKDPSRSVTLTVGVPADIRAGATTVGSVQFFANGAPTVEVPLIVEVTPTRRLEMNVLTALRGVRPGDRVPMTVQLLNLGNANDTIALRATLPGNWRTDGGENAAIVPPGAAITRTLYILLPRDASTGNWAVQIHAVRANSIIATSSAQVEIGGLRGGDRASREGLRLRVGGVTAVGPWAGAPIGTTYSADGFISDSIQLSAMAIRAPHSESTAGLALARSGIIDSPALFSMWSPHWRVAAGPIGGQLTDLTGANVGGQGGSVAFARGGWSTSALQLRPLSSNSFGTQAFAGMLSRQFSRALLTTTVSSLSESLGPTGLPRELSAVSAQLQTGSILDRFASSELAYRKYRNGSGLGAGGRLSLRGENSSLDVRGVYAAGGSVAFARGTSEFNASVSRRLTKTMSLNASSWHLDDTGREASKLSSDGWTLGADFQVAPSTSVNLGARSFGYTSGSTIGSFGSVDRTAHGSLNTRLSRLSASLDGSYGVRGRRTSLGSESRIDDVSVISRIGGVVSVTGRAGTVALAGSITDNGAGQGFPSRQAEYRAQLDQLPLLSFGSMRIVFGGSVARVSSLAPSQTWMTALSATLGAELPGGISLNVDADRNPLFYASTLGTRNGDKWIMLARVQRSVSLPRFAKNRDFTGVVFHDADGDGRQSKGETVAQGVVVRHGSESVVTGADGRYRFAANGLPTVTIDARSIPLGLVAASESHDGSGDFALQSLSPIEIRFTVDAADSARVTEADIEASTVTARDSQGRVWIARATSNRRAQFDGLPPGEYQLDVDFSRAVQPLKGELSRQSIRVMKGTMAPITCVAKPRALRFPIARASTADSTVRGAVASSPKSKEQNKLPENQK